MDPSRPGDPPQRRRVPSQADAGHVHQSSAALLPVVRQFLQGGRLIAQDQVVPIGITHGHRAQHVHGQGLEIEANPCGFRRHRPVGMVPVNEDVFVHHRGAQGFRGYRTIDRQDLSGEAGDPVRSLLSPRHRRQKQRPEQPGQDPRGPGHPENVTKCMQHFCLQYEIPCPEPVNGDQW